MDQNYPQSIFASVSFIFSHEEIWVQRGGGGYLTPPSSCGRQMFYHIPVNDRRGGEKGGGGATTKDDREIIRRQGQRRLARQQTTCPSESRALGLTSPVATPDKHRSPQLRHVDTQKSPHPQRGGRGGGKALQQTEGGGFHE